ncbi:MAG TPA: cohesin domain-containing protein [Acidobacteriaceae bacterium]|jgi:general secretion pathway protein D|nr:cohesin domain-containing protein [Acidobacteriaceae bacterium]
MKRSLVIWAFLAVLFATHPAAHAQSASHWYKQGETAEAKGDTQAAYEDYYQAYQKKPTDERFRLAFERTRFSAAALHVEHGERLRDQGDYTAALTEFLRALEIDPSNELASQDIQATREKLNGQTPGPASSPRTTDEALDLAAPVQLKPISNEPLTLHMVEDSRIVYQAVGKAAGINVLFDPSYTSKRIQVDLNNVTLRDALRIVAVTSNTFWRPITPNTIFVAENSRTKHTELDQQAVETFYLRNVAQQNDFTEVQTVLRNLFQNARINGVASENAIVMRGTPDELLLAHRLIDDLDKARPEVVIDVAVLEVSRDVLRNIGIQLPQTASINFQPSNANLNDTSSTSNTNDETGTNGSNSTASSITLNSLAHLNSTNFAVTIGQAAVDLLLTDTRSRIIQNPQIRASDGQEATLKIGERIPIATGSYQTGAATAIVSSLVNTQFQYIDVGVDMTIKPTIHMDDDVTLKSKITVSSTAGNTSIGGITEPIITQREVDHTVRLKNGEANLLGGILQHQTTYTISGTPGLGQLPLIKYLFSTQQKEVTDDEIVFLMIPHVVRAEQLTPEDLQEIDTGTGNDVEVRPIIRPMKASDVPAALSQAAAAAQTAAAAPPQSNSGAFAPQNSGATQPPPPENAVQATQQALASREKENSPRAPATLALNPAQVTAKVGSTFKVLVNLTGGSDVFAVPMSVQYDPSKLSLINVDSDDGQHTNFLGKDGQAVALAHRDDGRGEAAIAVSRPPGTTGVSGSGTVCVLTFQAKAPGDASIAISRPVIRNPQQQVEPATGSQAVVHIQ